MYKELIHEETQQGFDIKLFACEEHCSPDESYDYENEDHRKQIYEFIECNGLLGWCCMLVEVYKKGVKLGWDSLGGCSYATVQDFLNDGYYADMIDNALTSAKKTLQELNEG